jgi:penicillin-binding protein 1C
MAVSVLNLHQVLRVLGRKVLVRKVLAPVALVLLGAGIWLRCAPVPEDLLRGVDAPSTVIVDRHGRVLYEALTAHGVRVRPIDAAAIPPVLEAATLAAEDRRFHSHVGVDPVSLLRAARHNLVEGQIVEGGSTISQQVAKLLIQRQEGMRYRGWRAKVREMVLALRLEHRFSKRDILALYLNLASYGNQATGATRASQIYFGVDPSMLTPAQAAFIAALPQRPSAFNPWKNLSSARARQQTVLARMRAGGLLSDPQLREARSEQITLLPRAPAFAAPHFVDMVRASAGEGARLETTLDLDLQREVEGIVEHQRENLRKHGAANVAVVVLDNATGEWLAWEGSGNYADPDHGGAINGPLVPRQPGSALKPFTYALAFEQGRGPESVLADIPSHFPTAEAGVLYSPRNYDGQYRGPLLARRALAGSENVPAVALAADLGVPTLQRFLTRAGLSTFSRTPSYYGLGLTLGNAEVRLDELVAAYATFARGGVWKAPKAVRNSAEDGGQDEAFELVSPRTAFLITDVLSDPEAREYAFGRGSYLDFPFPVAAKTGTSQAYHDNWTIGYTQDVTVGVWVGNFDRTPLRNSSGVTGAGPIFHAVMLAANRGRASEHATAVLPPPAGLEEATICTLSGMRASDWCPSKAREWVVAAANASTCSWHHQTDEGVITIYPPEYRSWAASTEPSTRQPAPSAQHAVPSTPHAAPSTPHAAPSTPHAAPSTPHAAPSTEHRAQSTEHRALAISSPPSGAIYSIDPTLRREFQSLPLRVVSPRQATVTWLVDGQVLGHTSSDRALSWPLVVGRHQIEVRDEEGRRAATSVVVK